MTYHTEEYKGYEIKISQDTDAEDPIEYMDHLKIVAFHSRYNIGHEHDFSDPEDLDKEIKETRALELPVYMFDHGDISLSTGPFGCPWDSGQVGKVYMERDTILREFGVKRITAKVRDRVYSMMESAISCYSKWISGEFCSFAVTDAEGEFVDGCSGFDDMDYAIKEAKSAIDYIVKQKKIKHFQRLKDQIKAKAPLAYRISCPAFA